MYICFYYLVKCDVLASDILCNRNNRNSYIHTWIFTHSSEVKSKVFDANAGDSQLLR